jgi:hypothetical protein
MAARRNVRASDQYEVRANRPGDGLSESQADVTKAASQ